MRVAGAVDRAPFDPEIVGKLGSPRPYPLRYEPEQSLGPAGPHSKAGTTRNPRPGMPPMNPPEIFIGIDVSKARLDGAGRPASLSFAAANDADGIAAIVARLRPLGVTLVVMEATGTL